MQKKKVIIFNERLEYGGSDFVAIRMQQALDTDKYECVYCVRHNEKGPLEDRISEQGVRIIHQPDDKLGYIESYKFYLDLFRNEHFDIVHSHMLFFSAIVLMAAAKCKIEKRVAHSHFSQPLTGSRSAVKQFAARFYRALMRALLNIYATDIIGCSQQAGEFLAGKRGFKKKGIVLNNGIDLNEHAYNEAARSKIRSELGVENKLVLGHIGHMYYIKNQSFLLDVFSELLKQNGNAVLILVGDGEDRALLEEKCRSLGIYDKVKFLGFRNDVPQLMLAMDCFVFPSLHEGFPLTLIEAQASKLPCVVSDSINRAVELSNALSFVSLKDSTSVWCSEINNAISLNRSTVDNSRVIEEFDINSVSKKLEKIYLS